MTPVKSLIKIDEIIVPVELRMSCIRESVFSSVDNIFYVEGRRFRT
jgi:hypothetical protein